MQTDRNHIGHVIAERLRANQGVLNAMWSTAAPIRHFFLDDLLPAEHVLVIAKEFPDPQKLMLRSSFREHKRVGVDLKRYDPCIEEYLFAFQHPQVIRAIEEITHLSGLEADPTLYASGISIMGKGDFLNPHLDNSHDGDGRRYRVLNLLFYVSPNWKAENGGNLELWDRAITQAHTILSKFNRLVVMATHHTSWHSVSKVLVDEPRYCISNYYFSRASPVGGREYTHVTTFAGRPEEILKRVVLKVDAIVRNGVGRILPNMKRKSNHRISGT